MPSVIDTLTPRQLELAKCVAEGLGNRQIAAILHLGENTIKAYLQKMFKKLGVTSRLQLAILVIDARRDGSI